MSRVVGNENPDALWSTICDTFGPSSRCSVGLRGLAVRLRRLAGGRDAGPADDSPGRVEIAGLE
jgi:hypothetical protein